MKAEDAAITACLSHPVAFQPVFARIAGGASAGLFLSQLWYWHDKGADPDGWIYKTQSEIEEETCLTRWEQETARKALRQHGLVEEQKRGLPAKLYYRVNIAAVLEAIHALDAPYAGKAGVSRNQGCGKTASLSAEKPRSSSRQNPRQACGKTSGLLVESPQAILGTESTTQITSETTTPSRKATAAHRGDDVVVSAHRAPDMTVLGVLLPEPAKLAQSAPSGMNSPTETTVSSAAVERLVEKGVTRKVAQRLVCSHGDRRCMDWVAALSYSSYEDAARFLVRALEDGWSLPIAYLRALEDAQAQNKQRADMARRAEHQRIAREQADAENAAKEVVWNGLTDADRSRIEAQACAEISKGRLGEKMLRGHIGQAMIHNKCLNLAWDEAQPDQDHKADGR
ncbi:MAG TPA: hypothetical protein VFB38_03185 [Chthonomonadaceae bacterium]|nr:hypothetical protein [Chthonomonadaceae bacterium]